MAAEAAFIHSWRVGRWTATLTVPRVILGQLDDAVVEWSPAMPGRPLTASELAQYRAGRDAALADLARAKGLTSTVLEFGTGIGRGIGAPTTTARRDGSDR